MNVKNWDALITCFDTNFHVLFDEENLICTKNDPKFGGENGTWGCRTLNKILDDVNDYHSSTMSPHKPDQGSTTGQELVGVAVGAY